MRLDQPRVPPVPESEWSAAQKEAVGKAKMGGRTLNIFRTLANHPGLAKRWMVFANHIMGKSSISLRDREIVILRMGWLCKSGYEWGQHHIIGLECDMSEDDIEQVKVGADSPAWAENERLLIEATDQLHDDAFISDETWAQLSQHYSTEQLMDIVFTAGQYNLVSMALNTFGVQLDEGMTLDEDLRA
ncbi:MAG TPA: carboxymuconolactone decarboxylase family protein [Porticoccaceae bacterium]|nr:carboxymuconolactone decarboxylase family protein [Porticoccaceae bacterium]